MRDWIIEHWGEDASAMEAVGSAYSHSRHHLLLPTSGVRHDVFMAYPHHVVMLETYGDVELAVKLFKQQQSALYSYAKASLPSNTDVRNHLLSSVGALVSRGMDGLFPFRPAILKLLVAFGLVSAAEVVTWYEQSPEMSAARKRARSSQDGKHHTWPAEGITTYLQALVSLASAGSESSSSSSSVNMSWLDTVPAEDSTTLYICNLPQSTMVCPRTLCSEAFEQEERLADAVRWAQVSHKCRRSSGQTHWLKWPEHGSQASLNDEFSFSTPDRVSPSPFSSPLRAELLVALKVRAGRALGRLHTALGQHELSVMAFEAALKLVSGLSARILSVYD